MTNSRNKAIPSLTYVPVICFSSPKSDFIFPGKRIFQKNDKGSHNKVQMFVTTRLFAPMLEDERTSLRLSF